LKRLELEVEERDELGEEEEKEKKQQHSLPENIIGIGSKLTTPY
jgi:hypothetical protein